MHAGRSLPLSLKNRITVLTLLLFLIGIWSATFFAARTLRADMTRLLGEQQFSTVTTVARQLDRELRDGLDDLVRIANDITPQLLSDPVRLQAFLADHARHLALFNGSVRVDDRNAVTVTSVPPSHEQIGMSYADRDYMATALNEGHPAIGRPTLGKTHRSPVIGMAAPIRAGDGKVIGAVAGTIHLDQPNFFDQIAANRTGITGGYLIIAPRHGLIVTATDKSRVMSPAPPRGANTMNDRYVDGYEGYGIAISSRGVEELSAARQIPVAGWFLVGVLPTAEAFAPVHSLERRMFAAALLISLLAGVLVWWSVRRILRQQFAPVFNATLSLAGMSQENATKPAMLPVERDDEIGQLIGSFNTLLGKLADSEQHFRTLANSGSALIWTSGTDKLCNYFNEPWLAFTGRRLEQEIGNGWASGVHPDDLAACIRTYENAFDRREAFSMDYRIRHADGSYRWIRDDGHPRFDSQGHFLGYIGHCYDITAQRRANEDLRRAASVFAYAREGIFVTSPDGTIIDVNEAFSRITGYPREEVIGRRPSLLRSGRHGPEFYAALWQQLQDTGFWSGEIWNRRKDGGIYAELLTISTVRDESGAPINHIALFSDITAQKEHQHELEHIAHYDALTGLPNRVLLADRLRQAMLQSQRREQLLGVAYIDLDGFKTINDTHGHETGDQFLISLAQRMKHALREGDTLARLGGDEFVAILLDLSEHGIAEPLLDRLRNAAAEPVHVGALELRASASIGVTFYPQSDDTDADQLLRQADQAMYQAKLGGKNRCHFFDLDQDRNLRGRHESIERIREALRNREFVLHYQPKVNMRTGDLVGAEALIRWQHPEMGLLAPVVFLPVIEDHPLSVELGEWVIATALEQIAAWQATGLRLPVSVNVGARQLQQPDFVVRLALLLAARPEVLPDMLQLEVLETSALEDIEQVSGVIESCRKLGVHFALDDFGTGYSSLTYLKRLPARVLKIDQSFVRDMLDDADDLAILEGVLGLAMAFARESIAEGVETGDHGELLLQLGCELGQGYGIARPMPAEQIPEWIANWRPPQVWQTARRVTRDDLPSLYAVIEHRTWVHLVVGYLEGKVEVPPELHGGHCRFGAWLASDAANKMRHGDVQFQVIDDLHNRIHLLATELVLLHANGKAEEARARLPELLSLRDTIIERLQQKLRRG